MDAITFADKDNTLPTSDARRLVRAVDLNEIKSKYNATIAEIPTLISTAISNLISGAPGALDTLNELAAAIGDDDDFAAAVTSALAGKQATLVSGTNIKTVNGTNILGSGDIALATLVTGITKSTVGLGNVDNTSDLGKPISSATQTALNLKTTTTNFAKGVEPVGTIDGVNTVFTLTQSIVTGSEDVFLSGQRMVDGIDYGMTYPGDVPTITFIIPPEIGDNIRVNYIRP